MEILFLYFDILTTKGKYTPVYKNLGERGAFGTMLGRIRLVVCIGLEQCMYT